MKILFLTKSFFNIFLFSFLSLFFFRKVSEKLRLVDIPNYRKHHIGKIPLVGGISIYSGIIFYKIFLKKIFYIKYINIYIICISILLLVGILDDILDISVIIRFIFQIIVSINMIVFGKCDIKSIGNILGFKEIFLGKYKNIFTIFVVITIINAFNMIDGIDGLLGIISLILISYIGIINYIYKKYSIFYLCFIIISSMISSILFNLNILGKKYKIFIGNSGSTILGFSISWILIKSININNRSIYPVTILWIISIPLMDMINVVYSRIKKKLYLLQIENIFII